MTQAQAESTSNLTVSNQKTFSKNIHQRVLKTIKDTTELFDKFEITSDEDEIAFFNEVNHYYQDLATNIYHLRKIMITIGQKNQSARNLQDVVAHLNKLASSTQTSLNLSSDELKTKVKNDIVEIGAEVERLVKIIQCDDLQEYRQKVLDCQHDLVLCIERLKLHNQFRHHSIAEFAVLLHEGMDKIKNNLLVIKPGHQLSEEDFSHYTRHGIQILQNAVDYIRRNWNIENVKGDLKNTFSKVQEYCTNFIEEALEAIRYDNPMQKMLNIMENCNKNITLGMSEWDQGVTKVFANNKKDMEVLNHLLLNDFIWGLLGIYCINYSIEDATIKIDGEK